MTCVDSDMKQNGSAAVEGANAWSSIRCSFCYADDTVLFSTQPLALNELLFHIEECSGHYGLKINRSKCHSIHMYHESNIQFQDGTPVNKTQGIQDTTRTWLRLDILWKDPNFNPKWKLLIYDAVIGSKLLYSLETVHLTSVLRKELDVISFAGPQKNPEDANNICK